MKKTHLNKKLRIKRVKSNKRMLLLFVVVFAAFGAYIIYRSLAAGTASYAAFPSSSLVKSKDGRIHVFVRGTDGKVYFRSQTAPNSSTFNPWVNPVYYDIFQATSSIAAANLSDGRIVMFARGTDNKLYQSTQRLTTSSGAGDWRGWRSLGGCISSDPSAIKNANGLMQVFVRGCDNAVYTAKQTSISLETYSNWIKIGGIITSNITPSLRPDGKLEIFVRGADALTNYWTSKNVYVSTQVSPGGSFSTFQRYPETRFANSDFSITWTSCSICSMKIRDLVYLSRYEGETDLHVGGNFYATGDSLHPNGLAAYHGGIATSNPAAIGRLPEVTNEIYVGIGPSAVFIRGKDKSLYVNSNLDRCVASTFSPMECWKSLGGYLSSDPAVITNQDGRIQVFVRGSDNALYTIAQKAPDKNEYGSWQGLGGGIGLSPALQVTNF